MYKNWNKKIAKKYLICDIGIFIIGFLLTSILMTALVKNGYSAYDLTGGEIVGYSLLIALLPSFSFTGFVVAMLNMTNLSTKKLMLIIVFAVPFTVIMVPFGAVMTIPTIFKCIKCK